MASEHQEENHKADLATDQDLARSLFHHNRLSIEEVDQEVDHQVVEKKVPLHQVEQQQGQPVNILDH